MATKPGIFKSKLTNFQTLVFPRGRASTRIPIGPRNKYILTNRQVW